MLTNASARYKHALVPSWVDRDATMPELTIACLQLRKSTTISSAAQLSWLQPYDRLSYLDIPPFPSQ